MTELSDYKRMVEEPHLRKLEGIIRELRDENERLRETDRISKLIAMDVLNAVDFICGPDVLKKVADHAKLANEARLDNEKIDELECALAIPGGNDDNG